MADYKRLVSYMYNYENGVKRNNVGYARIEARDEQCKITIHIKAPSINAGMLKTYIFKRVNKEPHCILVGNTMVKNGVGELRNITKTDSLMESGYSLEEMGGIIVYYSKEKFFGSEWDDCPIVIRNLIELEPKRKLETEIKAAQLEESPQINWVSAQEIEEVIENNEEIDKEEMQTEKTEDKEIKSDKEIENLEENLEKNEAKIEQTEKEEIKKEEAQVKEENIKKDVKQEETEIQEQQKNYKKTENKEFTNNITEPKRKEDTVEKTEIGIEDYFKKQLKETIENKQKKEKENNYYEKKQEYRNSQEESSIFQRYPNMYPFEDDEILECVRIEPQDIGALPMETWILANNSFLLHGYYSYRHLILAKKKAAMGGYQYILGVPGIYQNREKFMANMFGFYHFKPVKNSTQKIGEFGYWYMPIIL